MEMTIAESNHATSEFYRIHGREDARPTCGYDFDHTPEETPSGAWACGYCRTDLTGPEHFED
jgi:hypothetical protein